MDNVKDYLEKLEIKNIRLEKQLKEVQVSKVIYFKEDRVIYMYEGGIKWFGNAIELNTQEFYQNFIKNIEIL